MALTLAGTKSGGDRHPWFEYQSLTIGLCHAQVSVSADGLDEAGVSQQARRLSHGHPTDAIACAQHAPGRQGGPGRILAVPQSGDKFCIDLEIAGETRPYDRLNEPVGQ